MEVVLVTGKSRAVRVSAMFAAAVMMALLLGVGVAQQVSGASGSKLQSQMVVQASGSPPEGCCPRGHTVKP